MADVACSSWRAWDLIDNEMVPTEYCPNVAGYILHNRPHWENHKYCEYCAGLILGGYGAHKYASGIEVEVIND
ncbi:hypothetical protein LCGC14_1282890 [marine sediment metagenome]|uniref:Uncharacterized protein n=1 Tax=marine sediment metagenome TaxID=412755 RepID=A0A0F9KUQ0_9ZZZZ